MPPELDPRHDDAVGPPRSADARRPADDPSGGRHDDPPAPTPRSRPADVAESFRETARSVLQQIRDGDAPGVDAPEYAVGETFPLLGEPRRVAVSATRSAGAVRDEHLILATDRGAGTVDVRSSLRELYRRAAARYFARRVVGHARRMGRDPVPVAVFDAPDRLFDAGDGGAVGFNVRGIMAPPEVVDHAAVGVLASRAHDPGDERFRQVLREHRPAFDYGEWLGPSGLTLQPSP